MTGGERKKRCHPVKCEDALVLNPANLDLIRRLPQCWRGLAESR